MTDENDKPKDKSIGEGFFTSVSDSDRAAQHAQKVNEKIKLILRLVSDADQLIVKNDVATAKRIYIECAEAMHKLSEQTKDDPNFYAALCEKKTMIVRKAEQAKSFIFGKCPASGIMN